MHQLEADFDPDYFKEKLMKVMKGFRYDDPHKVYIHDLRLLLKQLHNLTAENRALLKGIDGLHAANSKMQKRKYNMIALLTAIDAVLPEPADPASLPEDYQFDMSISWGLIKSIRSLIKGT